MKMKKNIASLFLVLSLVFLITPSVYAATCASLNMADNDGDGWVCGTSIDASGTGTGGCHAGYVLYPTTSTDFGQTCTIGVVTKKIGDCVDLSISTEYQTPIKDKDGKTIKSSSIYPNAYDAPGDGVDQACSGKDTVIGGDNTKGAQDILDNIRTFLTWVVGGISGIILILGGIMYAMAAGDETKTKKARKAMIGAIIGLVVALLANAIIAIVAQNIVK